MDKIFKAYAKLIDTFHKMYEDRNNELQKTTEFRINRIKSNLEQKLQQKISEYETLFASKKQSDIELEQLKCEHKKLDEDYKRVAKDNYRMKYILISNNKKVEAIQEDLEFYKFRVQEIKQKYHESSSDDEDVIKKVLKKNKPAQKETDVCDLEDYINGLPVTEYIPIKEETDKKLKAKTDILDRQKLRKYPISEAVQTDPPHGINFGIQVEDGEEVISHLDKRSSSARLRKLQPLYLLSNDQLLEAGLVEQDKLIYKLYRRSSFNKLKVTPYPDISKTKIQKILTGTDLHKLKTIDTKIY